MTARPRQGQPRDPRRSESATKDAVLLRRVNRWQAQDLSGDLADLYVDSREASARRGYRPPGRQDFLNRLTGDIRRPGFAMVVADMGGLAGCAFGSPMRGTGFWSRDFDGVLPHGFDQLTESGSVFAISDILVRPHAQDKDVARRLQERLLSDHHASLGATLVDRADRPTLTALRAWGWLDAGDLWRPGSATVDRVLVLPARERTAVLPEGLARDAWTGWAG